MLRVYLLLEFSIHEFDNPHVIGAAIFEGSADPAETYSQWDQRRDVGLIAELALLDHQGLLGNFEAQDVTY